jgi:alkylated DNA repair dioxygenase AlkB
LIGKVGDQLSINADAFAELLLTEYPVDSVINWHRDAPPFDIIVGISLMSDCIFRFRPYNKLIRNRKAIISIPLQRRSLYLMSGNARIDWEHSIPAVKQVRYSITLRTLREFAIS